MRVSGAGVAEVQTVMVAVMTMIETVVHYGVRIPSDTSSLANGLSFHREQPAVLRLELLEGAL